MHTVGVHMHPCTHMQACVCRLHCWNCERLLWSERPESLLWSVQCDAAGELELCGAGTGTQHMWSPGEGTPSPECGVAVHHGSARLTHPHAHDQVCVRCQTCTNVQGRQAGALTPGSGAQTRVPIFTLINKKPREVSLLVTSLWITH